MTPTKKGKASAAQRKGSSAATKKKTASGKRKPRAAGKRSTPAAKTNAASKPEAKKTVAKSAGKESTVTAEAMIRVMCSGRIQPAFVLRAFEKGADGVLVSGCHFGDCHYIFGNERAAEQFEKTKNMIKLLGIEEGRLRLEWISAAEGARFAQVINEFTDQVRDLGPVPFSKSQPIEQTEDVA
jgi:F420-non-reducing hydrogenase iron-sulfur subunit